MPEGKHIEVVAAIILRGGHIFATQRGYGEWMDWWEFPGERWKPEKRSIAILIKDKLSNVLTEEQKKSKIQNYLSSLRMAGKIEYKDGFWQIKVK